MFYFMALDYGEKIYERISDAAFLRQCIQKKTALQEAGFKKVKLNPALLGIEWAIVEIPILYGMIVCDMKQGRKAKLTIPNEIEWEMNQ